MSLISRTQVLVERQAAFVPQCSWQLGRNRPWAHLDICGPGWLDKDRDECNKGGTAFGVRTLSYYVINGADSASSK